MGAGDDGSTQTTLPRVQGHGGQGGFNPFSAPEIPELNQPTETFTASSRVINDSSVTFSNDQPKSDAELQAKLAGLQSNVSTIRAAQGTTQATSDMLLIAKDDAGSALQKSSKRVNGLTRADSMLNQRIPQQKTSIAQCEEELKKAEQECRMDDVQKHKAMLAMKKATLQKLEEQQSQVQAELPEERANNSAIRSEQGKIDSNQQLASNIGAKQDGQVTTGESLAQNLKSTTITKPEQS